MSDLPTPRALMHVPVAIAIPVRDEAERIGACLRGLSEQRGAAQTTVVLLLNNCRDATESVVRALAPSLRVEVDIQCVELPPDRAHAGTARSLAMQRAAVLAGPDGVLLTTDADSVAPPGWLDGNLAALSGGADAVAGRAVIDPAEALAIPTSLHEADARECAYAALLDEIASMLDPDPFDPWPRHDEASGASLAVPVATWHRVGGMAPVPVGEDRAFVAALRQHDCRIRHAPEVWVTVSGRIAGRAVGGMADTIRRRLAVSDLFLDERLEPLADAIRRATLRRLARSVFAGAPNATALARHLGLAEATVSRHLDSPWFGAAWACVEVASPVLARRPVPVGAVLDQSRQARLLRDRLLLENSPIAAGAAHPVDSLADAAD